MKYPKQSWPLWVLAVALMLTAMSIGIIAGQLYNHSHQSEVRAFICPTPYSLNYCHANQSKLHFDEATRLPN